MLTSHPVALGFALCAAFLAFIIAAGLLVAYVDDAPKRERRRRFARTVRGSVETPQPKGLKIMARGTPLPSRKVC